ncbi:IscS subfamily cysteine desulfurase [Paenibacillus elgii]|nr:IscS subfamily cysteine desulfurase [Paenibacillus elgii]
MELKEKPIYMDYSSTTPTDARVLNAMIPYFVNDFGNPHSSHLYGVEALKAVKLARERVAELIGAASEEIIFTSGATEANNLSLRSCAELLLRQGKNHLITTGIEHKSVLETFKYLSRNGFEISYLKVSEEGLINLADLKKTIKSNTGMVSVIAANNEIGVIQPIEQIASICKERNVLFHTDAVQAVGKIPVNVRKLEVDLLTLSGHKMYGPKGIGALFVSRKLIYKLKPIIFGGDQEFGIRPGTVPTPLCVGLGEACMILMSESEEEAERLYSLRNLFLSRLKSYCPGFKVNGSLKERLPGSLSISFDGVDAEALIITIKNKLAISTGSACTSTSIEPSHVLLEIGLDEEIAESTVRITFGRFTTQTEVEEAVNILSAAVVNMRKLYR